MPMANHIYIDTYAHTYIVGGNTGILATHVTAVPLIHVYWLTADTHIGFQ